jgi:hypothetical protein
MTKINMLQQRLQVLRHFTLAIFLVVVASLATGCGGAPRAKPVDEELARSTLKDVLDKWKTGATPQQLQDGDPKIIVQDPDWQLGYTLTGYEVLDDGEPLDANLYCKVKLQIENEEGPAETTATYCIGTDPVLTVFRDLFHSAPTPNEN